MCVCVCVSLCACTHPLVERGELAGERLQRLLRHDAAERGAQRREAAAGRAREVPHQRLVQRRHLQQPHSHRSMGRVAFTRQ